MAQLSTQPNGLASTVAHSSIGKPKGVPITKRMTVGSASAATPGWAAMNTRGDEHQERKLLAKPALTAEAMLRNLI